MAFRLPQRGQVLPKVVAVLGIAAFMAGSVLVFFVPPPQKKTEIKADPEPTVSFTPTPSPDPVIPHDLLPTAIQPKPKPVPSKKPAKPSASPTSARPSVRPSSPPTPSHRPVTPTPTPKPASTPPKPTPTPTVVTPPANSELRAQVISLINQKRAQVGVGQLASNSDLSNQCQTWSAHMASTNTLQHSNMTYSGEIIASGPTTAQAVVDLWMNSAPHREIMLNASYTLVGAGYVNGYWTVQFG